MDLHSDFTDDRNEYLFFVQIGLPQTAQILIYRKHQHCNIKFGKRKAWYLQYILSLTCYLPCNCVIDTVPMEWLLSFSLDLLDSRARPRSIRVGALGIGRLELSLLNMRMTAGTSGRSWAWSCTHSNAMWMHLKTCRIEHDGFINGSIISSPLSSFHCCHAWKMVANSSHEETNKRNVRMDAAYGIRARLHIPRCLGSPAGHESWQPSSLWWSPRSELQSCRHRTWPRKCLPWHIQETCSRCKKKIQLKHNAVVILQSS